MESAIDPLILGAVMIVVTAVWFTVMSAAGMREDDSVPVPASPDARGPWWTNEGFVQE